MKQKNRDMSKAYIGYLEDKRQGSEGKIIGVMKQSTLDFWAQVENDLTKKKQSHAIQFVVLGKAEGEKKYKSQFPKKKVESKPIIKEEKK